MPIPVVARSKTWICGHSLVGIAGSNPSGGTDMSLVSVVYLSVRSLVQSSPTENGVSECDFEATIMRGPRPTGGLSCHENKTAKFVYVDMHCTNV